MGPHFFKCGKGTTVMLVMASPVRGFNGAALFQVRKVHNGLSNHDTGGGFNGAALFQVRKGNLDTACFYNTQIASMGPHFFKCGKWIRTAKVGKFVIRFNGAALFQVRKVRQPHRQIHQCL